MNLIICDIPWYSGLSYYAIEVAKILKEKDKILWATEKNTPLYEKLKEEKIEIIPILSRKPINQISNYKIILKRLNEKPENILTFTGSSFFIGYLLKRKLNSNLIRFRTESYEIKKNVFNKFLYKKADKIVAGSKKIKNSIENIGLKNIEVIHLGVDTEKIRAKELKNYKTIGFLGRLDKIKGIDILWKTMNIVWKKIPSVKLLIAGKEEYYKWKEIRGNFKGNVEYLGFISEGEKEKFFSEISFGIITSKGSEATSRVLLEFFANSRTVVSTNVGIIPEILKDNKNGFIVERNNPEILAEKIIHLLNNPEILKSFSIEARKTVEEKFNMKNFREKILNLIK